jgi:hypothetical protein
VIRIGTTSYRLRSRYRSTLAADRQDTSCSVLRPPKITATLTAEVMK